MRIPPGLTEKSFSDALKEFADVVGEQWVFTGNDDLSTYRDEYGPLYGRPEEPLPSAAIGPDGVEQIQRIVKIANEYRIPLWVISTGKNWGYGVAPLVAGSVILDLARMNRILEVSEKHAYALVEPGVTCLDLYRHIQEKGLKLWMDGPSPAWGSVLAHTIERGFGHSILAERWNFECGMEIVLPTGEVVRTGMGGIPNAETWQQYKWGFGPCVDGIFSQSNLGIVTKLGTWLVPEPPGSLFGTVRVWGEEESIIPLIDILRPLRQSRVMAIAGFGLLRRREGDGLENAGGLAQTSVRGARANVGFYGLPEVVNLHWEHVMDLCSSLRGVEFEFKSFGAPYDYENMDATDKRRHGFLSMAERVRWPGWGWGDDWAGVIYFSHIIPFMGEAAWKLIQLFDKIYKEYGRFFDGGFSTPNSPRALLCHQRGPVSRNDPILTQTSIDLARRLIREGGKEGWSAYRVANILMDEEMELFSYNDRALPRFHESLKDALDPNGILAPGKNGIWPKHMRSKSNDAR